MIQDKYGDTLEKLLSYAEFKGKRILEIGCGEGRVTQMYAKDAGRVIGIEPQFEAICKAKQTVSEPFFLCGSGMSLPFYAENFDLVLFTLSLHHHPDCLAALCEARRVLCSGGLVLVLEPTPESQIQSFCRVFEDEDHRLAAAEKALHQSNLEITSKKRFHTYWEFTDFEDAANYAFSHYSHPPDREKRNALKSFLGQQAHAIPIHMTDTLQLTVLRRSSEMDPDTSAIAHEGK
jgi:ubiquinone/menaquinone biosynthesis C-methylase UbiE